MPQDAFFISFSVKELSASLVGGKINKVNQPNKDDVYLSIYANRQNHKLVLSTNAKYYRACLTDAETINPTTPYSFCMLLRKHLIGGTIKSISQINKERIIKIEVENKTELLDSTIKIIYVELMGKYSNVIITEKDVILGALKCTTLDISVKRILLPNARYTLPDKQDKFDIFNFDVNFVKDKFKNKNSISDFIFENFTGFSYPTCLVIEKAFTKQNLTELSDLILFIRDLYERDASPCLQSVNGQEEFFAVNLLDSEKTFDNVIECQNHYYLNQENLLKFNSLKQKCLTAIKNRISKLDKKITLVEKRVKDCDDIEKNKIYGELILSNIYKIKRGDKILETVNYYDNSIVKIPLDDKLSPSENSQRYYKKYLKQKNTLKAVTPQVDELKKEKDYLLSIKYFIDNSTDVNSLYEIEEELLSLSLIKTQNLKRKKELECEFRTFSKDGFTILVGKNNVQNDKLLSISSSNSLWLHVKNYHSAHAIIVENGKEFTDDIILYASQITAYYSQASESDKVEVDYTLKKNVKKIKGANKGLVTYTNEKTIIVEPLKVE